MAKRVDPERLVQELLKFSHVCQEHYNFRMAKQTPSRRDREEAQVFATGALVSSGLADAIHASLRDSLILP